jgi:hypothetical protein
MRNLQQRQEELQSEIDQQRQRQDYFDWQEWQRQLKKEQDERDRFIFGTPKQRGYNR